MIKAGDFFWSYNPIHQESEFIRVYRVSGKVVEFNNSSKFAAKLCKMDIVVFYNTMTRYWNPPQDIVDLYYDEP